MSDKSEVKKFWRNIVISLCLLLASLLIYLLSVRIMIDHGATSTLFLICVLAMIVSIVLSFIASTKVITHPKFKSTEENGKKSFVWGPIIKRLSKK